MKCNFRPLQEFVSDLIVGGLFSGLFVGQRLPEDRLPKRAALLRDEGRRRRGRPRVRWEDCVNRDRVRKAGEEDYWKKKTRDRGGWKYYQMRR